MSLICLCALVHASCVMGVKSVIIIYTVRGIRHPAAACALLDPEGPRARGLVLCVARLVFLQRTLGPWEAREGAPGGGARHHNA